MIHRQTIIAWMVGALLLVGGFYFVGPIAQPYQDQIEGSSTTAPVVIMVVIQPPASEVSAPSTTTTSSSFPGPTSSSSTSAPAPPPNTTGTTASPPGVAATISPAPEVEVVIAEQTDRLRVSAGLGELATDPVLHDYARRWAWQMAASGELEHSDISALLGDFTQVGENIGQGDQALALFQALVASPAHLEIMLGPYTVDGVGAVVDADGVLWVSHVFASSDPLPTTTTLLPEVTLPSVTLPTAPDPLP